MRYFRDRSRRPQQPSTHTYRLSKFLKICRLAARKESAAFRFRRFAVAFGKPRIIETRENPSTQNESKILMSRFRRPDRGSARPRSGRWRAAGCRGTGPRPVRAPTACGAGTRAGGDAGFVIEAADAHPPPSVGKPSRSARRKRTSSSVRPWKELSGRRRVMAWSLSLPARRRPGARRPGPASCPGGN